MDSVDLNAARKRNIAVLNTPDVPTQAVAELALTMMLALSRNLIRQSHLARGLHHDLSGKGYSGTWTEDSGNHPAPLVDHAGPQPG